MAIEQPGPVELAVAENPFDLANEGVKVTKEELAAAKNMDLGQQRGNIKINMDAWVNYMIWLVSVFKIAWSTKSHKNRLKIALTSFSMMLTEVKS